MRCPRCQGETAHAATRCPHCGAPIALGEEPAARPLDRAVDLDRRGGPPAPPAPSSPSPPPRPTGERAGGRAPPPPLPSPTPDPATAEEPWTTATAPLWAMPRPRPAPPGPPPPASGPGVVELRRAGSGRRALAWAVDGLPFFLAGAGLILGLDASDPALAAQLAAVVGLSSFAYQTLAHTLAGATLGKRLLGLRVVGPDGRRPGPGRSALRAAVAVLGTSLLGVGPLLALFTRSGRALHDLVAGTAVVADSP